MVTKKGRFGTDPYIIFANTGRRVRFPRQNPLAHWERVRVRGGFGTGCTHLVPRRASQGRRPLRMLFLAWLQRRVGLEPTPTIFFTTKGRVRFSPRPSGEGQGEGRIRRGTSGMPTFSLAQLERVRVREGFKTGRRGRRPLQTNRNG